jgi:hypothetical protein
MLKTVIKYILLLIYATYSLYIQYLYAFFG